MNDELQEVSVILATAREELKKTISSLAVQREQLEEGERRLFALDKERQDKIKQNEELSKALEVQYSNLRVQLDTENSKRKEERENELQKIIAQGEKLKKEQEKTRQETENEKTKTGLQTIQFEEVRKEYGEALKKHKELKREISDLQTLENKKKKLEDEVSAIEQEKWAGIKSLVAINEDIAQSTTILSDFNQKIAKLDNKEAEICFREKFHEEKKQNFIHIAKQLAAVYDKPEAMAYLTKFL